ncbi:MAG TPA: AI-2E family transporter [Candidatus Saccharimonadales bacterium]|nr:AI-2E family transporter [Candidatus Saccharimonadales bacterium]
MFTIRSKSTSTRERVEFTISNRTVIRVLILVVVAIVALAALRRAQHALILIFTGFFLSLALNAPVHWIAERLPGKRKGSRAAATAISFFVVIAFLAGFIALIVPPLVRQTSNFIAAAPSIVENARDQNGSIGKFIAKYNLQGEVDKLSHQLSDRLGNIGGTALGGVQRLGSSIFSVLTILVLTFMMLIEGPRWLRFIRDLIPDHHHSRVDRLALDMYKVVKGYVNGQVVLAFIAACMLLPALVLLHISYPAALLVVVFICGLIPLIGHSIGAVIVTTVALFHSPWTAAIVLAYYILYQQIENYIIQPRIQANSTNMSPLLVFAAVIIGVSFGGLFGGLVAIPVMGCIRIAVLDYLRTKHIIEESTYQEIAGNKKA